MSQHGRTPAIGEAAIRVVLVPQDFGARLIQLVRHQAKLVIFPFRHLIFTIDQRNQIPGGVVRVPDDFPVGIRFKSRSPRLVIGVKVREAELIGVGDQPARGIPAPPVPPVPGGHGQLSHGGSGVVHWGGQSEYAIAAEARSAAIMLFRNNPILKSGISKNGAVFQRNNLAFMQGSPIVFNHSKVKAPLIRVTTESATVRQD